MNSLEIACVKIRNGLNRVFPCSKKHLFSAGIITAAGSGTRMGNVSKQLLDLCGKPCIVYSLLAFQNCGDIDEIVLVAKKDEIERMRSLCREYGITKLTSIVVGGDTRQASVEAGFAAASSKCELIAIHDGARPLIRSSDISCLLKFARRYGAASAAMKMTDTVKRINDKGMIAETLERDSLYTVQTPQVFKADLYRISIAIAQKSGFQVTDDCSLAEHAGFQVYPVDLGHFNGKITHPQDLDLVCSALQEAQNA